MKVDLRVRVDGLEVQTLRLRRGMVRGFPCGPREIVVKDASLGTFALNDDFIIEVLNQEGFWQNTTVTNLLSLLESKGVET